MNSILDSTDGDQLVPFSVPLAEAQKRVSNWINADPASDTLNPAQMRAFVVNRMDFKELLEQHDTEFIRLYIGMEDVKDTHKRRPCVLLVSAVRQGDIDPKAPDPDLIVDLIGTKKPKIDASEEDYHVFDFSKPCPTYCDEDSPLFVRSSTGEGC